MATILIVDDQPEVCEVMQRLFKAMGWVSVCLTDPKTVHGTVRDRKPNVVLLDVMMPQTDGFSVLREIRADAEVGTTPVIMYSALGDEATRRRALEAGADDYIVKGTPFKQIRDRVGLYVPAE